MINKKLFFEEYRKHLDKTLSQKEVDAIDKFLDMTNSSFGYFKVVEWSSWYCILGRCIIL